MRISGQSYTDRLRSFNDWFEQFMVEASRPLIMLGFIFGTVNMFTGGTDLARSDVFTVSWAIVQAISIDGLFFAVLSQLKGASSWQRRISLGIVMLSLASVAFLVNDTLSFQELNSVSMRLAMDTLGVPAILFTHVRAGLVVVVSIASALVLERKQDFTQVVSEIVQEVESLAGTLPQAIETDRPVSCETEIPLDMIETDEKPSLRLISSPLVETTQTFSGGEIEAYMRQHNCSRATAYRRMKKERKEA